MKQVLQNLRSGITELADVPQPAIPSGHLLIRTSRTLLSSGTERMLVEFGKASLFEKARQQPDKVRLALDKIRTDGLLPTIEAIRSKLEQPIAMGYCNVGTVIDCGSGVSTFNVGDRVVSNGKHAEVVTAPKLLCAKVPPCVSDDEAVFTVIGAIALQGIRLVHPTLGETVVVIGLGLVGLVTVQLLRAQGCRVLGIDLDRQKVQRARQFGVEVADVAAGEDPLATAHLFSRGRGVDAVIVTAATESSEPIHNAAVMCRKRGRIVLVGVTGLELSRQAFYEKELTFQVSCSYGPGRYDPAYEEKGQDYPVAYVRWTEQRNFEAVLDMMADGRLDVRPLISHRFMIDDALRAYETLASVETSLGILLEYPRGSGDDVGSNAQTVELQAAASLANGSASVSFIGSGNYANAVLIPAFKQAGAQLRTVASSAGVSGAYAGRKFGFQRTTTALETVLADDQTNAVVITTRHDSHARLVLSALLAGKHVFVEKPLCLTNEELAAIEHAARSSDRCLMVGFNRRFAPHALKMKALLTSVKEPKAFVMTVNAGAIPPDHWTHDLAVGGGRIVGEACHFIDLLRSLAGSRIRALHATAMGEVTGAAAASDNASITITFEDGSIGTIHYLANGHRSFPKERVEVFAAGRILRLDNFRKLTGYGWRNFSHMNLWRQDKGQNACAAAFVAAIEGGATSPIPLDELIEVSRVSIEAAAMVQSGLQ